MKSSPRAAHMFYACSDHASQLVGYPAYAGSPCERDGLFLMKGLIEPETIRAVRLEVLRLLYRISGMPESGGLERELDDFQPTTERLLVTLLRERPGLRGPLVQTLRKLPVVQGLTAHPGILEVLKELKMVQPVERANSLQVFLPWEELFRERPHQDFGFMLSEQSWTLQIPLHDVVKEKTGSAEVFPGTYRHGPLQHHLIREPNGYFYETVDERWWRDVPPRSFDMEPGDVTFFRCLNVHQTYPRQRRIRWSLVIRYDDCVGAPLLERDDGGFGELRTYDFKIWNDQLQEFLRTYRVPDEQGNLSEQRRGR